MRYRKRIFAQQLDTQLRRFRIEKIREKEKKEQNLEKIL